MTVLIFLASLLGAMACLLRRLWRLLRGQPVGLPPGDMVLRDV